MPGPGAEDLRERLGPREERVEEAPSLRAAETRLLETEYAAVVCAASARGAPISTVRRLRRHHPTTAVVVLGPRGDLPGAVEVLKAGADDYLRLPDDLAELGPRLDAAVARRRESEAHRTRVRTLEEALLERDRDLARQRHEARALFLKGVRSLVLSLEAKDAYTKNHSKKVAHFSDRIAAAMGLGPDVRRTIRAAALLHDVGKIGVDDAILRKEGPLTPREYEEVKKHPLVGARILSPLAKDAPDLVRCVRHEHEHFDGTGYPDGLTGYAIPLGARIIAVADCYDAIVSDRPYRRARGKDVAATIVRENRGTQFDPEVVDAFLAALPFLPGPAERGQVTAARR